MAPYRISEASWWPDNKEATGTTASVAEISFYLVYQWNWFCFCFTRPIDDKFRRLLRSQATGAEDASRDP